MLFGVVFGNPTGFYRLELWDPEMRFTASKLCEFNSHEKRRLELAAAAGDDGTGVTGEPSSCLAAAAAVTDTSQWQNRENFRNAWFRHQPIRLSSA